MSNHKMLVKRTPGRKPVTPQRLRRDPAAFADTFLPHNEKGKPWQLTHY
jgi:hypothetical protein